MVATLLVAGGIAAASALAGYLSSKDAQKASANERKKLEELLAKIQAPNFDPTSITPEEYRVVGTYVPQVAPFIEEQAPQLVNMNSDDAKMSRNAMRDALLKLRDASTSNLERDVMSQQGQAAAAAQAQSNSATLRQEYAQRGLGGSGLEFLDRIMAGQGGSQVAAKLTAQAEMDAYRNKLQALKDSANLGGQIRDDEYRRESQNAGILNDFNQRLAARKQNWANVQADTLNEAQLKNLTNQQDIGNKNVGVRNNAAYEQRDYRNDTAQKDHDNAMGKAKVQADISDMARQDITSGAKQQQELIAGLGQAAQTGLAYSTAAKPKKKDEEDDDLNPLKRTY